MIYKVIILSNIIMSKISLLVFNALYSDTVTGLAFDIRQKLICDLITTLLKHNNITYIIGVEIRKDAIQYYNKRLNEFDYNTYNTYNFVGKRGYGECLFTKEKIDENNIQYILLYSKYNRKLSIIKINDYSLVLGHLDNDKK